MLLLATGIEAIVCHFGKDSVWFFCPCVKNLHKAELKTKGHVFFGRENFKTV